MRDKMYQGFGVNPLEGQHHFYVIIGKTFVEVFERYRWNDEGEILKLRVPRKKWDAIAKALVTEFNVSLKLAGKPAGRFSAGGTPIERMLGKEMMVLLWAIQGEASDIRAAISNWKGLTSAEKWWLYNMTNANAGGIDDNKGWRMALRYALCDNPIG